MFLSLRQKSQVLVTGTFNIVHAGHCELFEFASQYGSVTIGINNDPYVRQKYSKYAIPLVNRIKVLKANRYIDRVVAFSEDEPSALIRMLKPDFYVKGPDYVDVFLPEQKAIDEVGARLLICRAAKIGSSTSILTGSSC